MRPAHFLHNLLTYFFEPRFENSRQTWEDSFSESKQEDGQDLPQLLDARVQFGDHPDESFAIYTRIDQPADFSKVLTLSHH